MDCPTLRSTAPSVFGLLLSLRCLVCGAEGVLADDNERWPGPFGGFFNAAYGLPSADYWYWQVALVTSAYGLHVMVAYTDTSIDPAGCAYTSYCSGRVFMSVSKAF